MMSTKEPWTIGNTMEAKMDNSILNRIAPGHNVQNK